MQCCFLLATAKAQFSSHLSPFLEHVHGDTVEKILCSELPKGQRCYNGVLSSSSLSALRDIFIFLVRKGKRMRAGERSRIFLFSVLGNFLNFWGKQCHLGEFLGQSITARKGREMGRRMDKLKRGDGCWMRLQDPILYLAQRLQIAVSNSGFSTRKWGWEHLLSCRHVANKGSCWPGQDITAGVWSQLCLCIALGPRVLAGSSWWTGSPGGSLWEVLLVCFYVGETWEEDDSLLSPLPCGPTWKLYLKEGK